MKKYSPLFPIFFAALAIALISCGGSEAAATSVDEANQTATSYLDLEDFLQQPGESDGQYQTLITTLANNFLDLCGDTFCGSDYGNLTPLAFNCSVTSKEGKLKACSYIFAGSFAQTDARTGALSVTAKTFTCTVPVSGSYKTLLTTLLAAGSTPALQRPLPGSTASIYDAISTNCLP